MRTLIVDDEPSARRRLRRLTKGHPDVEIAGECATVAEALDAVEGAAVDLVFLDIELPEADGFRVVEALPTDERPAVVFVTAFSEHALRAFDVQAVDYLLKPFSAARLEIAIARAREYLRHRRPGLPDESHRRRLAIDVGGRIVVLATGDIDYVTAEGNYVRVHGRGRSYLMRGTLSAMERRLDPREFLRIHRSTIVRLDRIQEAEVLPHGELDLTLTAGTHLISGRTYRNSLRSALALDH